MHIFPNILANFQTILIISIKKYFVQKNFPPFHLLEQWMNSSNPWNCRWMHWSLNMIVRELMRPNWQKAAQCWGGILFWPKFCPFFDVFLPPLPWPFCGLCGQNRVGKVVPHLIDRILVNGPNFRNTKNRGNLIIITFYLLFSI